MNYVLVEVVRSIKNVVEQINIMEPETTLNLIREWVRARNIQTGDPKQQICKTLEELGELASALNKNNLELAKDGIGDTIVTLIAIAEQLGLDINECLDFAYNEIKDRKGKLINGIFVKDADIKE